MRPDTVKTRGLHVGIRFAPRVNLDKQHKQQFQAKCNEGFDWRRQDFAQNAWQLVSPQVDGDPRSQLKLSVHPDGLNFEDFFPTGPLDLFFDNLKLAMECVASVFKPRMIVGSGVAIRQTMDAEDGDARIFLGQRCLNLDDRLEPLGRPVHAVGLKMLLPPLPGEGNPKWHAEVKIESLVEDVSQLYVEVDARWTDAVAWNPEAIIERVKTTHAFAATQIIGFLEGLGRSGPPL